MKRYIKASQETSIDIVVVYRNKIIYDGPITAEPTEIFKNIKNFNPNSNIEIPKFDDPDFSNKHQKYHAGLEDANLIDEFEYFKEQFLSGQRNSVGFSYRNAIVWVYNKEYFDDSLIVPQKKADPNTAVIDGERMTAEEVAQEVMSEADNYEYVYDGYQDRLAEYAKKVVENGWENTSKDHVPFSAVKYVVDVYIVQHNTRKQNLAKMCRPFINEYMQEDYDRYKSEYQESLNNETSDL